MALRPEFDVDWVPVDKAAKVILELSPLSSQRPSNEGVLGCFHSLNPQPRQWKELATAVQRYYSGEKGLTLAGVGLGEWLGELRAFDEAKTAEVTEHCPALIKLLDFFGGDEG